MTTITIQDIKSHGARAIPDGKSVLVPPAEYELLLAAMEELEDIKAIEERRDEPVVAFSKAFPKKKR